MVIYFAKQYLFLLSCGCLLLLGYEIEAKVGVVVGREGVDGVNNAITN